MHKRLAVPAAAAVSLLALTACSGGGDGTANGGDRSTVTVWMYPVIPDEQASQQYWASTEEDFEAEHSDIDLVVELQPWDNRDEKIATALAAGSGPDLVLLTADQALTYHSTGGLKPLDDAIEPSEFYPQTIEAVTYDGSVYGYPLYQTSTTTVYNTALFEQAGIEDLPTTWDDVLAAAPALAEEGVAVLDYSGSPDMTLNLSFYPLLWQAGGSVFTEDGTDVAFDSPEGVAALEFLLDLQEMNGLPADAATKPNMIEGGPLGTAKAAMGYAVTLAEVEQLQAAVGAESVAVGEPLTGAEQVTFGTPGVLSLTTINEDPEAAHTVAQYLGSAEVTAGLHEASGTYPVRTEADTSDTDELTSAFIAALEYARPGEVVPNARQVMAALVPHLQAALQGQVSAQEALDAAAAEAREIIQRAS